MKKIWRKSWWLAALALPLSLLLLLPLGAQQTGEKADSSANVAPAAEPEPAADAAPGDEHVSADNNLTFPIDI
jgi:hypothetical protein